MIDYPEASSGWSRQSVIVGSWVSFPALGDMAFLASGGSLADSPTAPGPAAGALDRFRRCGGMTAQGGGEKPPGVPAPLAR